jgi:hypothetical protein
MCGVAGPGTDCRRCEASWGSRARDCRGQRGAFGPSSEWYDRAPDCSWPEELEIEVSFFNFGLRYSLAHLP